MQFGPRAALALGCLALLATASGVGQELVVGTLAGRPTPGYADAWGRLAQFNQPAGLEQVGGILFVADSGNHSIRQIDLLTGEVSTVAGTGEAGHRDGPADQAQFRSPRDILHEPGSNALLVADSGNHMIRAIQLDTNRVTTLAGTGTGGWQDGPAEEAQFREPSGLCFLQTMGTGPADRPSQYSHVLVVADTANHCLRGLYEGSSVGGGKDALTGAFSVGTIAGTPGSPGLTDDYASYAQFNRPIGLAAESATRILIADSGNHAVRLYDDYMWQVTTVAGDGTAGNEDTPPPPGTGQVARFNSPAGITAATGPPPGVDSTAQIAPPSGHVVLDTGNSRLREVDPVTLVVSTFAGSLAGYRDAPVNAALFHSPWALAWHPTSGAKQAAGPVAFISDKDNHCIRSLGLNMPPTADPGANYVVGPGDSLMLDGTASSDADLLLGDFVTEWAWDLNNDRLFGDAFGSLVHLDPAQVWHYFGTPDSPAAATYPYAKAIALEVTDLFGATNAASTTVSVTGDLSGPVSVTLLAEPQWTAGTVNELRWTTSDFAVAYELQWSRLASFEAVLGQSVTQLPRGTASALKHNVTYHYRVRALLSGVATSSKVGAIGGVPGPWSNVERSTQDARAPRSRIVFPASPCATQRPRIPLRWEATESGSGFSHEVLYYIHDGGALTRYPGRYYPSTNVADGAKVEEKVGGTIPFDISRANGEGVYQLFTVGVDNVANREWIGRVPDLILIADATPPTILAFRALNITQTTAEVVWRTNEPTTGAVEYGVTPAYGSMVTDPTLARTHIAQLTGLRPRTVHYFRIRARDRAQNLTVSGAKRFRTREPIPPAPVLKPEPRYTRGTANTLSWGAVPAIGRYVLQWDMAPTFPAPNRLRTGRTQATATGLSDGVTYLYRVAAVNGDRARGPWSNTERSTQDASPPRSAVALAPVTTAAGPVVHLTPTSSDATSGVRYLVLYFAKDRGPFRPVGPRIAPTTTDVAFDASPFGGGHYAFYTRAVDRAGNREAPPPVPDVEIDIKVPTRIAYVGDLGTTAGQSALIAACLTDTADTGVSGAVISYAVRALTGSLPGTDDRGFAQATVGVGLPAGTYDLVLTFTGDPAHRPSQAKVSFLVKPAVPPRPAQQVEVQARAGLVDGLGDRYEFNINVTNDPLGGAVVVRDLARSKVLRASGLTSVTKAGNVATITGLCSVDGAGSHRFVIRATDGTPDTLGITTTEGTFVAPTALATGTVTITVTP